jgi:hypothetical protein
MCATDQFDSEFLAELFNTLDVECATRAAFVLAPTIVVGIRIGPQQITQQTGLGDFARPWKIPNVIETLQDRREPAVDAEDLPTDNRGNRQALEDLRETMPHIN